MATVSDRIYSELPDQPAVITAAFQLDKAVPKGFCTKYLEQNVKHKNILAKGEHDLKFAHFVIDGAKSHKQLPRFNRKHKKLTSRERRKLRIHDIPKTGQLYSNYLQLHHLWLDYMKEVLKFDRPTFNMALKGTREILLRADYHGCLVKVIQSKCPTYTGESGIIILDTREVFKIIRSDNVVKNGERREEAAVHVLICHALEVASIYRDIKKNGLSEQITLKDSYNYDSVLCGCVVDVDFDGLNEILIGTFGQKILAYKFDGTAKAEDATRLLWEHSLPYPIHSLRPLDLTGDGLKDLAVLSMRGLHILQKDINKAAGFLCERLKDLELSFAKLECGEEAELKGQTINTEGDNSSSEQKKTTST